MARYDYICHDCEHVWEVQRLIADRKEKEECPVCDELCRRYYGDQQLNVHFDQNDTDFHSVKARRRKINKQDFAEYNKNEKEASRKRQSEGWRQYSRMDVNHEYFREQGLCRQMSDKENSEAHEKARNLAGHLYDKSGIDKSKHRFNPDKDK